MSDRVNFEMSEEDLNTLLDAMRPTPMIMLQCGTPPSRQEQVNNAWTALGKKLCFDHMTALPNGKGARFFSAVPRKPKLRKDGDQWCATHFDFVNLQESPAGFGDTPEAALAALLGEQR